MAIIIRTVKNISSSQATITLIGPGYDNTTAPVVIVYGQTVDLFTVLGGEQLQTIQPVLAGYLAMQELQVMATVDTATFNPVGGGGSGVGSLNGLTGPVTLAAGANVTITPSGSTITIASTGGGGGSPAGSNTQIQFNDGGVFGASPNFTFNKITNSMSLGATTLGVAALEVTSASIFQSLDFFELGYDSGLPPPQAASLFSVGVYGSAAQGGVYMLATNALTLADNTIPAFGMEAHIGNPSLAGALAYYLVGTKHGGALASTDKLFVLNNAYTTDLFTVFGDGTLNTASTLSIGPTATDYFKLITASGSGVVPDIIFQADAGGEIAWTSSDLSTTYGEIQQLAGDNLHLIQLQSGHGIELSTPSSNWLFADDGSLTVPGQIHNLVDPTAAQDAATKNYVDTHSATPAGSDGNIQFNNAGSFGADANLDFTGGILTLGLGLSTTTFKLTTTPTAGYVLTSDGSGTGTWQAPGPTPLAVLSSATVGGAQAEEVTVAGLHTTSTIWAVTQQVVGGAALPLTGWTNVLDGHLNLTYSADMGPGARVLVLFIP